MIKEYTAPDGAKIIGTLQTVLAVARIEAIESTTGEAIYTGDADIKWETMRTIMKRQQPTFVDEHGRYWRLPDLHPIDGVQGAGLNRRHGKSLTSLREARLADADRESNEASSSEEELIS